MRKKLLALVLALAVILGVSVFPVSADSSFYLSDTMIALRPGESDTLFALSSSGTVDVQRWSSSNPSVATVSDGHVQGISYGIATVTAYLSNGSYASCQVHVALMGIDVSYHQGYIDWNAVADSGLVDFAIIRTGYGGENWTDQVDQRFAENYAGAVANGIDVGVYHFSYATTAEMARREAEFCLYILDGRELDYPVFYDIETADHRNMDSSTMADIVEAFCTTIEQGGYDVALYSSPALYNGSLSSSRLDKYDRWVAHYGVDRPVFSKDFVMWQSGFRTVPGISGNVDADYGYKDYSNSGGGSGSGGNTSGGGDSGYTMSCDVNSYTFGSNTTYQFKVTTNNPLFPTVQSSDPDIVSVAFSGTTSGGYLFTLTRQQKAGDAIITIIDDVGNVHAFMATNPQSSSSGGSGGGSSSMVCDTSSYSFVGKTSDTYIFKITTSGGVAPTVSSSNSAAVSASYYGATSDGFLYQITNRGAGQATITVSNGSQTLSFIATGRAVSSGGGSSGGGSSSGGTLPCDTSAYTFTTLDSYIYKVTTSSSQAPTAVSSNPSAVSVAYHGTCPGGYLFRITNQGAGQATITTTDADGRTCSFVATGRGSSGGGSSSGGTLPCDTSAYTFTTLDSYIYKVTTSSSQAPTAVSSNPSAVSVAYHGTCPGGYLFRITNQGAGQATITTTDADGRTCSFVATGRGSSGGGSSSGGTIVSDTTAPFNMRVGSTYTFKFTVTGGGSPQFASGNSSLLQLTQTVKNGNDYLVTFRAVQAGQVGVYASADGPHMDRMCIIDVI